MEEWRNEWMEACMEGGRDGWLDGLLVPTAHLFGAPGGGALLVAFFHFIAISLLFMGPCEPTKTKSRDDETFNKNQETQDRASL